MQSSQSPINPCLTSTLTSCQPQSQFWTNNFYTIAGLSDKCLPHFVIWWNTSQVLLNLCLPGSSPHCSSNKTLYYFLIWVVYWLSARTLKRNKPEFQSHQSYPLAINMSNNPAVTLFLGIAVAMQWMEMDTAFFCPRKLWMPAWNFGYIWGNHSSGASLVAKMVKNLPAMWESWVWSLGWEDPVKDGMATHSSILAWKIPMDKGAWWATVHGVVNSWTWLRD